MVRDLASLFAHRSVLLSSMVVVLMAGVALYIYFLTYLRTHHESTWQALGQPAVFEDPTAFRDSLAVMCFLVMRRHRSMGDPRLSRLCDFLLGYIALAAAVISVGVWLLFRLDQSQAL
jgi:hypothetical protein